VSSSQNLIVIGYAKLPAASASHSVHEYVSIVLLVDGSTGHVSEVDSTAVTALVRAFIRELLLGQDLTQSVEPILTEIDRSYLGHAAASIKQAVSDAWRLDRVYTPGALRFLDLEHSGPHEVFPGVTCQLSGGHTPGSVGIVVETGEGQAYLCGDLFYDVEGALRNQPRNSFVAGVQPAALTVDDPALSNNFTTSVLQEMGAVKRALQYRYILPSHDDPGVLDRGRYVGRIRGDSVPGPISPVGD